MSGASIADVGGEGVDVANRIALAEQLTPISLAEINRLAALQTRADNKYFLDWPTFTRFMERLRPTYAALEIDGKRFFSYDTQYFDTPGLDSYWAHVQRRRKRFKCRSRRYLDSDLCVFELKLKGGRGETIKHKIAYDGAECALVNDAARTFLQEHLGRAYGLTLAAPFEPALRTRYQRLSLAPAGSPERVTCDFDLAFAIDGSWEGQMAPGYVLVETKSAQGRGHADLLLWQLGARPSSAGSKYCLGMSLLQPALRDNPFLRTRRRYFVRDPRLEAAEPRPAPAAPTTAHSAPRPAGPQPGAPVFAE